MGNYHIVIGGVIGSSITLLLTSLLDYLKEKYRNKIELRKLVFQRKTDAVERAISWLQEASDCYRLMQSACDAMEYEYTTTSYNRLVASFVQANKLYENAGEKLNPIYLYYNFSEIEKKYNIQYSWNQINLAIKELEKLDLLALEMYKQGMADDCNEVREIRCKAIDILKIFSKHTGTQTQIITEIMDIIRNDYQNV